MSLLLLKELIIICLLETARDLIMVTLPKRLNFLFDHWLSIFLTLLKISSLFRSQMLKTRGENVTSRIFSGSWDQSNAIPLQKVSGEPQDEPIHNALVLSTFILRPGIV